jgi:tetratricopeptide (TPR) repeat protein
MKIPELSPSPVPEAAGQAEAEVEPAPGENVDLGEDLLEGATRLLLSDRPPDATAHLVQSLKRDNEAEERSNETKLDLMLKKAERYIAKRNYYLARKALRHSLALGADEALVKSRLSDIRRMEFPEGLYNSVSSDEKSREHSSEILERLEKEFDLQVSDSEAERLLSSSVETQLDEIFRENDPRTILDFGVALHEMGLFRQAESVFSRIVDEFPENSFDAYYLAAVSKFSRRDYAGAASILRHLSADGARPEIQKIQIYYTLGELFEKMDRPERSKEFFRKVAELDANYRNIRNKLED